ncbi:hypothetical protein SAMN05880501_10933 [Ureibacillus xyleni]|uniref:Uncharacterized protein n=1 Tax=Ureibacillus xyleni TaxID=614648 RepID=A0A285T6W5_9BACL|nr:hypothetical protein [Ureibacillus xyleni]SOC16585.1 hypothetical protein SAMN05880501_10933 [Ureibacillus xyleni]
MSVDHIERIVHMFSKKELEDLKKELELTRAEEQDVVDNLKTRNIRLGAELLLKYKHIFKPSSSHIYTYEEINFDSINEFTIDDWTIIEKEEVNNKYYIFVEKDTSSKKINAGWTYTTVDVKQVGIIVIHKDLNVLEIRSNLTVQKQLERKINTYFLNLESLVIDRGYYTAILEELNAKEFSIVWGTEGVSVKKAQIEGEFISVKNGAVIHVKDDNGDIIAVDLGTEGTPESVWSTLQDTDTKILLSSKGNIRVAKLVSEVEMNKIVLNIVSALKGLQVTKNEILDFGDTQTLEAVFIEFCMGANKHILKRFSKRYFAFRCLLSNEDAGKLLSYLLDEGFIKVDYEILCEHDHHINTFDELSLNEGDVECTMCTALEMSSEIENNQIKKVYKLSGAGKRLLEANRVSLEEGTPLNVGMSNVEFNDEPVELDDFHLRELEIIEIKEKLLEEALEINDRHEIEKIVKELSMFKHPKASEVISKISSRV